MTLMCKKFRMIVLVMSSVAMAHQIPLTPTHYLSSATVGKTTIEKNELIKMIKEDIAIAFSANMWSDETAFDPIDDKELAHDLKDLYDFPSEQETQKKLDAFCKKWDLSSISVEEEKKRLAQILT